MHVYVCEQMTYCGNKREKAGSSWIFHEYVKEWHVVEVTRQRVTLRSLLLSVGRLRRPFRIIIFANLSWYTNQINCFGTSAHFDAFIFRSQLPPMCNCTGSIYAILACNATWRSAILSRKGLNKDFIKQFSDHTGFQTAWGALRCS